MQVCVYDTRELAIRAAADWVTARVSESITLAGGSTPRALYDLLAHDSYRERIDWADLDVFFGDERAVKPTHPDSNYGMAYDSLLAHVDVSIGRVHRMEADDLDVDAAASRYAEELPDRLDVVILGLGTDGHTASLFPGGRALAEQGRLCVATQSPTGQRRMTLTLPALNAARHLLFLALGVDKQPALAAIKSGSRLPAGRVKPSMARSPGSSTAPPRGCSPGAFPADQPAPLRST